MSEHPKSPNPAKAPRPRWFGHPAFLFLILSIIVVDVSTMHRHAVVHTLFAVRRTGPTFKTFASLHGTPDEFRVVWRDEWNPSDESDFLESFATGPYFLNTTNGLFHATSVRGYCLPWHLMDGLDERKVALAVHRSALESGSQVAQHFRNHYPQAMNLLSQGKLHYRRPLPMGYLRNTFLFGMILTLFASTIWGRADLWIKRILKAIGPPQRDPNACPECGYDVQRLKRCPECGKDL